jgi:formylmethanofuran dehydrogenase subunit E
MNKEDTMTQVLDIEGVKRFHGHWCPGLAMGIRVAELALREIGPHAGDEEVVAIVETDNCAVDAIQYFTGCTFGKGNLIHRDYGKNAFTFIRRSDGKAIRIAARPDAWGPSDPEREALLRRVREGQASESDRQRVQQLRQEHLQAVLAAPAEKLFDVQAVEPATPDHARLYESMTCAGCGEHVMETRVRFLRGQPYCIPCFEARDRRL